MKEEYPAKQIFNKRGDKSWCTAVDEEEYFWLASKDFIMEVLLYY